jgi:hypothetical protein
MRIPDAVKKCVVFIGIKKPSESFDQIKYIGTGFFVSIPAVKIPDCSFPYLVTAKHVAVEIGEKDFFIRANSKDGGMTFFKGSKNFKWWFHPDPIWPSDVAVFPMTIPPKTFKTVDYSTIHAATLLTDEERMSEGIGEGDEVATVGLFSHHTGSEKNIPIIRMGNIAMISDEPIRTAKFGNMEAYLIEMRSIGGLSGSPVFVLKPVELGRWKIHLLGLIHGHWDVPDNQIIDATVEDAGIKAGVNVGIAMVIPAKKILETLNCKELADNRAKIEAKEIAKNSPTPD